MYVCYVVDTAQDTKSPDNVTVGNRIACHTAPATEFEAAFVGRAENLTSVHRRQRVHHFHPGTYIHKSVSVFMFIFLDTATYDPVMHSQLSSQLETTCTPELEPNNAGGLTAISHSMLQTTTHVLNTSTTQQLDIIHDSTLSDVIPADISETHDCVVSGSNLNQMNGQSEINTSSMSNNVHSHAEPGSYVHIICYVCISKSLAVGNQKWH